MQKSQIQKIKKTTTKNVLFLSFRNLGMQAISTLGFFTLSILLGTAEVGLFAIVAESVGILGYFSDIGLASALIQQKDKILKRQLKSTFTIQQALVFISLFVLALSYHQISLKKGYGSKELWITVSLAFSFVCASLKTIPSVLLERKLNFKLISYVDLIENITFYVVAVVFALLGFGAYSYAFAAFSRSLLGLILIYHFSPWPIGFALSLPDIKKLFRFGIPFQFNSFIAMAKDRLSNLLVAGILGRSSFGLLAWAQKGTRIPLSLMDAVMKVTFPTFSRLQSQKEVLKKSIERSTFFIALLTFPALTGIALVAPDFIALIPKYGKWLPALVPLYFYSASAAIASVTTPLTNAFNAIGKITLTTKFMIMWTLLTWPTYFFLSKNFGYVGTSWAVLIVGSSSFVVWLTADKIFSVNIFKTVASPFLSSLLMALALLALSQTRLPPPLLLTSKIIIGLLVYSVYHLLFSLPQLKWFVNQLKSLRS